MSDKAIRLLCVDDHYLVRAGLYCKLRVRGCTPAEAEAQIKEQKTNEE